MATAEVLVDHPLFSEIDLDTLHRALAQIPASTATFTAGQVVRVQGDPAERLTVISKGNMTATIETSSGKSLLVETLSAPDILAPAVIFSSEPVLPVTLTATSDGVLISITREHLEQLGRRFPAIYLRLLHEVGEKFNFITMKMRLLHFATLRQKIAGYLLGRIRSGMPPVVELPYTRERLAELFGVARPSLSRALGEFVHEGVLEVSGHTVTVRDMDRLREETQ